VSEVVSIRAGAIAKLIVFMLTCCCCCVDGGGGSGVERLSRKHLALFEFKMINNKMSIVNNFIVCLLFKLYSSLKLILID